MDTSSPPDSQTMALKLLEDLELTNIPDDQKQPLIAKISELVDQEIMYAILSRLSDEDIAELEKLLEVQGEVNQMSGDLFEWLSGKIPNFGQVIEDALVAVYDRLSDTNNILSS